MKSGFVSKVDKSTWIPVQMLQFLGNAINSKEGIIKIPYTRMLKVINTINDSLLTLRKHRRVHVKMIASLVGQIISMSIVIGTISQIMTRYLSMEFASAPSWKSYIKLSQQSIEQLNFWKSHISEINEKDIFQMYKCTRIVYSDASQKAENRAIKRRCS